MSSTERSRKLREELKQPGNEQKLEEYQIKQKQYYKKFSSKQLSNKSACKKFKAKKKKNSKKTYAKKKDKQASKKDKNDSQTSLFPSKSARSKAISKVNKALPSDLDKGDEIIKYLALKRGIVNGPIQSAKKPRKGYAEVAEIVIDFYASDLVSKQMPGIRDYVLIKNSLGVKEKVQKRILLMPLAKVYTEFQTIFNDLIISFSKFCELRPKSVLLFAEESHYSFKCIHCTNMEFIIKSISCYIADFRGSLEEVMHKFCCDPNNFLCIEGKCPICHDYEETIHAIMDPDCFQNIVTYKEWRKDKGFSVHLNENSESVQAVVEKFLSRLQQFKFHMYLKKTQQRYFYDVKHTQSSKSVTIVMDYAENYTTKGQNEVQASHFARKQISVFTAMSWIGQEHKESFAFINDNIQHSKDQVHYYIKLILSILHHKYAIEKVFVFSDGCSSQFKNRYIMSTVLFAQQDYGLEMEWNFFCTSHGKSSADGIGAVVKRGVYKRVMLEECVVYSAAEFVECCATFCDKTIVLEVPQSDVVDAAFVVQERWEQIKNIDGMRDYHLFKASTSQNSILMAKSSLLDDVKEVRII